MSRQITIDLDRVSDAALGVLTADGTKVDDAVRSAIIDVAERRPWPGDTEAQAEDGRRALIGDLLDALSDAPPLSIRQRSLLESVFGDHSRRASVRSTLR